MSKTITIAKAWFKFFTNVTEPEHRKRAEICSTCDAKEYSKFMVFQDDDLKEIEGFVCGVCKCPLSSKIRSTDKCPKGKW